MFYLPLNLFLQEGRDFSDTSSFSDSMASMPNFEELDDVVFGVSTRHQWHQLINQIEATNHANKKGNKKTKKKNKNVLQEQNRDMFSALGHEQDLKGGAKVCHSKTVI